MPADRACVLAAQPHDLGAETIDLSLLIAAGFRAPSPIRRLAAHVRQGATSCWAAPEDHHSPGRVRAGSPMTGDAGGSGNTTPAWPGFGAVYRRQPTFRWPPRPKCGRHDPGISGCMVRAGRDRAAGHVRNHPPCMRRCWPPGGTLAQYEQSDAEPARLPGRSPVRPGAAGGRLQLQRQRIRESIVGWQPVVEHCRSVGVRLGGVVLRCRRAARITAGTHQHQAQRERGN